MNNRSNEYISDVLRIANDLMCLSGDGDKLGESSGSGILSGVMRDCAYKIRRHAEHEGRKAQRDFIRSKAMVVIFAAALLSMVFASPVSATTIILSTDTTETLDGLTFNSGDLAEYNPTTNTATLYFDGTLFGSDENIDAVHILANGNIILSVDKDSTTLGGLTFGDGDLIEYNPTTDVGTLYLTKACSVLPKISMLYTFLVTVTLCFLRSATPPLGE